MLILTKGTRMRVGFKWVRENMDVYASTRSLKLKFVCYKSLLLCYNRIATLIVTFYNSNHENKIKDEYRISQFEFALWRSTIHVWIKAQLLFVILILLTALYCLARTMCVLCIFYACVLRASVCRSKFTSIKLKVSRNVQFNGYVTANKSSMQYVAL